MSARLENRPNDEWLAALQGDPEAAGPLAEELSEYLRRVLGSTLSKRHLHDQDLADLTQEAMLQIVRSLATFRGDSAFTTWAAAVATRVAFTELRRRAAREAKHVAFRQAEADALAHAAAPEHLAAETTEAYQALIRTLHEAIDEDLCPRQRVATLALLRGVPKIEIAEQMQSNQNAVYKLVHDARLRLRTSLAERGVTMDLVESLTSEGGLS